MLKNEKDNSYSAYTILSELPEKDRTVTLCAAALIEKEEAIRLIPDSLHGNVFNEAISMDGMCIRYIPIAYRTKDRWLESLSTSAGESIVYMLESEQTEEYWLASFQYGLFEPARYITQKWFKGEVRKYLLENSDYIDILYLHADIDKLTEQEQLDAFYNTEMCERYMQDGKICPNIEDYGAAFLEILATVQNNAHTAQAWTAVQLEAPVDTIRNLYHTSGIDDTFTNEEDLPESLLP